MSKWILNQHVVVDTRAGISWWILELACRSGYYSHHVIVNTRASMSYGILEIACRSGYLS